jgi:UDP-N-acetyl-D-mannosaminuronic acid transferase (WecB/TagA/CpsF family)
VCVWTRPKSQRFVQESKSRFSIVNIAAMSRYRHAGIMEAQRDPMLKPILNAADLVVPDSMPLVWFC